MRLSFSAIWIISTITFPSLVVAANAQEKEHVVQDSKKDNDRELLLAKPDDDNSNNDRKLAPGDCSSVSVPNKPSGNAKNINVDGNMNDWSNSDFFATLYEDGLPGIDDDDELGKLYARYTCGADNGPGKLCIRGQTAGRANSFVPGTCELALYDIPDNDPYLDFYGDSDTPTTFMYNTDSTEFEACFDIPPSHQICHNEIEVRVDTECDQANSGTEIEIYDLNFRIGIDLTCDPDITGDPHLMSWGGQRWDYHGECDLVAMKDPNFDNGKGLELHVRTTRDHHYSYTNEAALKIGDDIFEVHSMSEYKLNGVPGDYTNTTTDTIGGFPLSHWHSGNHRDNLYFHRHVIELGNDGEMIEIKTFENIVYINVRTGKSRAFVNMNGLFGHYSSGLLLGRDGVTQYEPSDEYALEWQVRSDIDNKLFSIDREPIYPNKCLPPKKHVPRLGHKHAIEQAVELCAEWDDTDKDNCVFDVMASGNKDLAMYKVMDDEAKAATVMEEEDIMKYKQDDGSRIIDE